MKPYLQFMGQLDKLLIDSEWGNRRNHNLTSLHHSLNGGAASALRSTISLARLRKYGAFFTGDKLGKRTLLPLIRDCNLIKRPVCDPACGAGDLLLRWAEVLPVYSSLEATLSKWEQLLTGSDICAEFVSVAKRRLVLMAIARGAKLTGTRPPKVDCLFPDLKQADILASDLSIPSSGTVILNPPFTNAIAPHNCNWSSGKVSLAAVMFLRCLSHCNSGQHVAAILPDVLRSGSRYVRWRKEVQRNLELTALDIVGRFDPHTDIDVFILRGVVNQFNRKSFRWHKEQRTKTRLEHICALTVGSVVPHRHKEKGPRRKYLVSSDLPPWKRLDLIMHTRRFAGPTLQTPFVAVRRTSSPSDPERGIATLVAGKMRVALENHIIAIKPRDALLRTCKQVLAIFKDQRTRDWLDNRIRCRHLTIRVLRKLPVWNDFE